MSLWRCSGCGEEAVSPDKPFMQCACLFAARWRVIDVPAAPPLPKVKRAPVLADLEEDDLPITDEVALEAAIAAGARPAMAAVPPPPPPLPGLLPPPPLSPPLSTVENGSAFPLPPPPPAFDA